MNSAHVLKLGNLRTTTAARRLLDRAQVNAISLVERHARGDWGDIGPLARRTNYHAAQVGRRVMSTYMTGHGNVCVTTEPDRSWTTLLLPQEVAALCDMEKTSSSGAAS